MQIFENFQHSPTIFKNLKHLGLQISTFPAKKFQKASQVLPSYSDYNFKLSLLGLSPNHLLFRFSMNIITWHGSRMFSIMFLCLRHLKPTTCYPNFCADTCITGLSLSSIESPNLYAED